MSSWVAYCSEGHEALVRRALALLDGAGDLMLARSADVLRRIAEGCEPGELGFVVGPIGEGVSAVNLAAAVARCGNARCVVMVCDQATGSLRSRAARAGVDRVVDAAEVERAEAERRAALEAPGGAVPGHSRALRANGALGPGADPVPPACAEGRAPVIVLCSGRGGVGKTTIAAGAAAVAARWELRACLIDLDLSCGNAYASFGLPGGGDLAALGEVAPEPDILARLVVPAMPDVALLGPCGRPELAELVTPHVGTVLAWAERAYDLVVVDASTTFTDAVAEAVQRADRVVLVADGRPGALSSVARMGGLVVRLGVARTRVARVENRVGLRDAPDGPAVGDAGGLEAARTYVVADGGDEVDELVGAGRIQELCEPGYQFADTLATMLAQLLAELGRLPEHDEAHQALDRRDGRPRRGLLHFRKGASR